MPAPERESYRDGFDQDPELLSRGTVLKEGTIVFVDNGTVGEITAAATAPKILYVAQNGELAGIRPERNVIILSNDAVVQRLSAESLETSQGKQLLQSGNQKRLDQLEAVSLQSGGRQQTAFGLHELSSEENPYVHLTTEYLGQWVGLRRETVSKQFGRFREQNLISGPTSRGIVTVLDREYLGKLREYPRPVHRPI
jgi:hypothetical protein